MIARDGPVSLLDNAEGQLCPSYPLQIVLPHTVGLARADLATLLALHRLSLTRSARV
jgi:hypothetical protein